MAHHVAVGALVGDQGVLMVHRRPDLDGAPDSWSFPGGHIEPGETALEALVRELREELGVTAVVDGEPHLFMSEKIDQPDGLVISLWLVREWSGIPTNSAPDENDDIRWVRASDLGRIRLAHWSCEQVILNYARHPAGGV